MDRARRRPIAGLTWRPAGAAVLIAVTVALGSFGGPGQHPGRLAFARAAAFTALRVPPLYLGLDSYLNLGKLSYLEIGDRVAGQSTADPGGSNNVVQTRILFDQTGPGVVTFMRMQQTYGSPWQVISDGDLLTVTPANLGQGDRAPPSPPH